jgi:dipeptidyl aminopeptidase/acylaminoacyl peptidase
MHRLVLRQLIVTSVMFFCSLACGAEKRVMTPDDLFRLEAIREVVVAQDGSSVAYVIQRPMATVPTFGRMYLYGNDRADVWVVGKGATEPRNITNGRVDASSFWDPVWSPDGQWLAMLSTRGGNIRLWVWNKSSGRLDLVSERAVNLWPFTVPSPDPDSFLWISSHKILFWVAPEGEKAQRLVLDTEGPEKAEREWARARNGRDATASVLESGIPNSPAPILQSSLLVVDVSTHGVEEVSTTPGYGQYCFATPRLSPDGRWVAFLRQTGIWHPDSARPVTELINPIFEMDVARIDRLRETHVLRGLREAFAGSLLWSPDSTELAVIGHGAAASSPEELFRCSLAEESCHPAATTPPAFDLWGRNVVNRVPYLWFGKHELVMEGRAPDSTPEGFAETRKWWVADGSGQLHDLFAYEKDPKQIPTQLLTEVGGAGFLGVVNGRAWRINKDGVPTENLAPSVGEEIRSILPAQSTSPTGDVKFVLTAHHSGGTNFYLADPKSGRVTPIPKPSLDAELTAFDPRASTIAFTAHNDTGTYLWLKETGRQEFRRVVETNVFVRGIEEGKLQKIEYRSLDGQNLKGWILLPAGYSGARRYPLITWTYAGSMFGDEPPMDYLHGSTNPAFFLNLQLLAAHGYVVLMPSMPLKPYGQTEDPYLELTNGVLPAVDKAIEMGIADPQRIGVMGHSYGGYSTYGLITLTNRFKAAVALAGPCDWLSLYGTFLAPSRYNSTVHEEPFRMWDAETEGMGSPPWKDLGRYIRNSPIMYVERVHTPLLIVQGDLDYISIQQGEEFFTALYRQNKRAEFIRYWGEDHLFSSPANIRDLWGRIYAWLDQFLGAGAHQGGLSPPASP